MLRSIFTHKWSLKLKIRLLVDRLNKIWPDFMFRGLATRSLLLSSVFLLACETTVIEEVPGPQGPQGPRGLQGPKGDAGEEAFTFEYTVDFEDPEYSAVLPFPDDFQMLSSDVAVVYALWAIEEIGGEDVEIWRALPQTVFTDDGLLQYNYDFTMNDISVFLDADFPLSILGADYLNDWLIRVVVIPAQFQNNGRMASDYSDYNAVVKQFGLQRNPIDNYYKYKSVKRPAIEGSENPSVDQAD